MVSIVVAWELSWYRYEVDLGDEAAGAKVMAQGTELGELAREDLLVNAVADEHGTLEREFASEAHRLLIRKAESSDLGQMIYCVVPKPLADELYPKLVEHYQNEDNVTVIVDRREFDRRARRGQLGRESAGRRGCAAARDSGSSQGPRGRGYAPARDTPRS